jgi:hypothetical protein
MRSGIQEEVSVDLQHINVKLLVRNQESVDLDPLIPVFHSWIQGQICEELLLDVADYRHVRGGPGVLLIGHEADYSLDNTDNRLGVRYNRKAVLEGGNQERLAQAAHAALKACQRLEEDSTLNEKLKLSFNGQEIEIFVNDRALAPNREDIRRAVKPDFQAFADRLFGGGEHTLFFDSDPRRLLKVSLKASRAFAVQELLQNLAS